MEIIVPPYGPSSIFRLDFDSLTYPAITLASAKPWGRRRKDVQPARALRLGDPDVAEACGVHSPACPHGKETPL